MAIKDLARAYQLRAGKGNCRGRFGTQSGITIFDLRAAKEGIYSEQMAAVFD